MKLLTPPVRDEIRACLRLAGPLMLAQLSFVGMTLTDTIMAGHYSQQALAAVAVGFNIWTPVFILFMGVFIAVSPVVAQLVGARQPVSRIGAYLRRALMLALALGALWWLLLRLGSRGAMRLLDLEPATMAMSLDYLDALGWAAPAACVFFVLRGANEGMGYSRPVMVFGLGTLAVNALFDYLLIFGHLGLPALGATGAGWATTLSMWLLAAGLGLFMARGPDYAGLNLFRGLLPPAREGVRETLRIGLPIAVAFVLEAGIFSLVGLLMAGFSAVAVAAHQIAITFAAFTFMMPVGLALATTSRVGQAAGAGDVAAVRLRGRVGIGLAFAVMIPPALLMTLAPGVIVRLYTDDAALAVLAGTLLRLAGIWQVWDGLQVSAAGALRGLKDTRVTMLICVLAYWLVALPLGYGFGFGLGMGPAGLWWGLIAGLVVAALGLNLRFYARSKKL
jgi:MATE family multidrug resistance protein